ncbi:uncharacterized protein LOC119370380 [Jatropha curcas]|uniref:uncharacterized protein LOC119370380 n=1 Tax=Jatropha curcas TaxID=180498 RepID=UPI001893D02E|nr:uncharacterized protein LOC119370380 [Jatropha curcas]
MSVQARSGFEYFVTFTDDFSKYGYIYLLRRKSKCFEKVKEFKAKTEKRHGKYIKSLRSDRGGEYLSREFITYLSEQGITSQLSAPDRHVEVPGTMISRCSLPVMDLPLYSHSKMKVVDCRTCSYFVVVGELDDTGSIYTFLGEAFDRIPEECELLNLNHLKGLNPVGCKWIYKKEGIDAHYDYEILAMDVKTSFPKWKFLMNASILKATRGNCVGMLNSVKDWLSQRFDMKDLGEAAHILRIKLMRDRKKRMIGLSQALFIDTILARFSMQDSKKGFLPFRHGITLSKDQWTQCPKTP